VRLAIAFIAVCAISTGAIAEVKRSKKVLREFVQQHACPATGLNRLPCKGYVIDHIKPLACGGEDATWNLQWQTRPEAKAKDKWERKECNK
jgi:5-methylcytosine-specific restriction endonuclease McrA